MEPRCDRSNPEQEQQRHEVSNEPFMLRNMAKNYCHYRPIIARNFAKC